MNDLLQLKGQFEQKRRKASRVPRNIPKKEYVTLDHLRNLKKQLESVYAFWLKDTVLNKKLITILYCRIIPKSCRIQDLIKSGDDSIVGAKFSGDTQVKHIITHCISLNELKETIDRLSVCMAISSSISDTRITHEDIQKISDKVLNPDFSDMVRSTFVSFLVDAYYVEDIYIDNEKEDIDGQALITIYNTGIHTAELMRRLNIDLPERKSLDETTLLLTKDQYALLKLRAPYLIAMAVTNISALTSDEIGLKCDESHISIPEPYNEPVIGVIDTLFDKNVYFSKWVEFKNLVDKEIPITPNDYDHGTRVSSIIVDGSSLNPELDDGCGRFRVRHFGVAARGRFNSFTVLQKIQEIVASNRDIKVWNLSLGSELPVHQNFISPEAAVLDKIQYENDVIFVIAGTNKPYGVRESLRIGSPADSINSLVVNSVQRSGNPSSYSRQGPVLSFFMKPDVSYYGGDIGSEIKTCAPFGESFVSGTSYAAPWISRKLAYLIHIMGLSREIAKALLINSACSWQPSSNSAHLIGFGVIPKRIEDIINSPNDEIRFVLSGVSEKYDTYNYNIPVPISREKHPFIAKAVLCYFPNCSRNQGVDYTNTEFDLHFGRIKVNKKNTIEIKCINDNKQNDEGLVYLREQYAREYYRKWDNVKHIVEYLSDKKRPKTAYDGGMWGISIKTTERLKKKEGEGINFGVVITLKEINGVNRIEDFIQQCSLRGWLVNRISVENRIDIYNKAEEEVVFE